MTSGYLRGSNNLLAGASAQGGYTIERSLRFRSSASAYLNRTPASASNRTTWTWSGWIKLGKTTGYQYFFGATSDNYANNFTLLQMNNGTSDLAFYDVQGGATKFDLRPTQLFRDPSAWYHLVLTYDSTNATSSDRVIMYVNGSRITAFSSATYPTSSQTSVVNSVTTHNISTSPYGVDGYMAEINFIDGQALTPSDFGNYNEDTGVWQPVKYTGSYGTNGFYLPFSDNTNTTTLVADSSGNGNDWTPNNISLTSGVTYDSMTDTPTPYASGGNYAVMNPVASITTPPTFANGNLEVTGPSSGVGATQSTFGGTGGKFYVEVTVTRASDRLDLGIAGSLTASTFMTSTNYLGTDTNTIGYGTSTGVIQKDNTNNQTGLVTCTTGDVVGMAIDMGSGTIQFYKNNSTVGTAVSFTPSAYGSFLVAQTTSFNTSKGTYNFGQRPFAYTPPTGFLPLHTGNLPDSIIVDGSEYFNTVLYTGNTSGASVTGVGFQPDFVWVKNRDVTNNHELIDAVRGGSSALFSNLSNQEATQERISSFDSDGWTYTTNSNSALANPYVGWTWKANGAGVSNDEGSITSTVSANLTSGFSIVTYTGNGSDGATVGHGLNSAPKFSIIKNRDTTTNWDVTFEGISGGTSLNLDTTSKVFSPTLGYHQLGATTLTLKNGGSGIERVNTNTEDYIAYCFVSVAGFSKFGSYTGNGLPDGTFVYLGFRPRFVMIKRTDSANNWVMFDTSRDTYNAIVNTLSADSTNSEAAFGAGYNIDFLSNGFKPRNTTGAENASGGTYIYMAFAENPFKNSLAR